jgi:eukaryotic-like serine/threonine-protein kinase
MTDGRVKILDFGLAKLAQSGPEHQAQTQTASGMAVGTPAYMSPEQVRGQVVDHRSDIFSLGAVLYEMLAGRRPFLEGTSVETMNAILKQDPAPITGVSSQLDQILRHCLEKEPADRYQSARDLGFQLRLVRHPSSAQAAPLSSPTRRRHVALSVVGLVLLAALAALTWWLMRPAPPAATAQFTRLTFDSGLTTDPAFSPDGRLVAYASDRAGAGNLDIWIQQLATGEAVKLTSDPADESEPTFSPDGSRIAFRSERDGGGIYTLPAFGGEPRLVAPQGRRPRFSPDGTRIAYWVGIWYTGRVFTVSSTGGSPSPVQPEFVSALYPVWSGDGSKLLFMGTRDPKELAMNGIDWWVAPASGGPAVRSGALDVLRRQRITDVRTIVSFIKPADWVDDDVLFSGSLGESTNLWQIAVSPETGKSSGSARRLTFGTAEEAKPSVASAGRIVFASLTHALNIWSVPISSADGKVNGVPQQLTSAAVDAAPTVSTDSRKLAFISRRLGNADVWLKDLESGKEIPLTATPVQEQNAEISADGSRICYTVYDGSHWALYQVPTMGGVSEKISDDGALPWDWSPDGSQILYMIEEGRRQPTTGLGLFDVATRQKTDYVLSPKYSLARARFSPDGRWIAVMAFDTSGVHIVVIPFRREGPPREDEWVAITEHRQFPQDKPRWSPNGNLLYYTSEIDGFRCIWAQRLDPATKRPIGPPLEIYHSHSARRSLANAGIPILWEIAITRDKLFFNLGETTGNIWMAEWKQ